MLAKHGDNVIEIMEESKTSNESQSNSGQRSRIKKCFFYSIVIVLYIAVLSPSILPTYFYFTSEKPELKAERRNHTSGRNLTISSGYTGYNVGNSSYCNHPFIPQQQQLYNITLCVPQCGWSPLTRDENYQINATTYTACIIAIISLILILMTWCKVSELWKFPHFIIVIMLTESTTIVSFVSVAILLGNDVFCSSKFLSEASKKATTFCIFQGALIHYLEGSVTLWFVAYNVVVAKGLVFEKLKANVSSKWPFIISAAVCWILPVIPVVIVLTSRDGYSVPFFANFCFPSSREMFFYTAVLPENVLYAVGVSFLYIIVWKLLKERQAPITASHDQAKTRKSKMDSVVKRLTLLMIFYCATVYLTYGSNAYLLNKSEALETSLKRYITCLNVQPKCPRDYRKYVSHIPLLLNYVAAGIFPLATVLFMAANERTRRFWKQPFHQLRSLLSQHTSSTNVSSQLINEASDRQLTNKSA